jgi:Protein of unknown function (DUF2934)
MNKSPDQSSNGSTEGSPADQDREERIRRRAYQLWGRQDDNADDYWHRAAQDLDREDADLQRSGSDNKSVARNRA